MKKEKFKTYLSVLASALGHIVGKFLAWWVVAFVCYYCWNTVAPKFGQPILRLWDAYSIIIGLAFLLRFAKKSLTE